METREDIVIDLGNIVITLPVALISSLVDGDGNVEDLHLYVYQSQGDGTIPVTVGLGLTRVAAHIVETDVPFIVEVDLSHMDSASINTNRIVALLADGTMIGGRWDTGMFVFEAEVLGSFVISYVANLVRIGLQIGSRDVMNLIDNTRMHLMDVEPIIQNNRTLVPLRFVAYALDAQVDWNRSTRVVTITRADGQTLSFAIGETAPGMDVPAQIMDNRTMVPLRFISEFFGAVVSWDAAERRVEIIR